MKNFAWLLILVFIYSAMAKTETDSTATDSLKTEIKKAAKTSSKQKKKPKEPKFEDLVEDFEKIEGLFTFYQDFRSGKVYMEIRPDQLGPVYLCNITREAGDGSLFDGGAMLGEFPFYLEQVGKKVQFIQKNVAFRTEPGAALQRAIERDLSNSLWASVKIASQPHPETGSILVDVSPVFLKDFAGVNNMTSRAKMSYSFDKDNSSFSKIKSFPFNSEIEVKLHFKSSKSQPVFTLPDSRSMFHRYHYSLSALPETDYKPRKADDRVGHFLTMYQDYSSTLEDSPYKRYITRWHLEKAEPRFKLSKPRQPIVFWLENTIPVEYRDAVKEGVLLWNKAFEKIGFEDAIVVKQMPDDAEWDPADVRYNTIRWIVQPGGGYAVGPHRANPFTGQIYDADIRVSADFVRFYFREFNEFVKPLSWNGWLKSPFDYENEVNPTEADQLCRYSDGLSRQMAFGWNLLLSRGHANPDDLKKYIHDGIVSLIVHEVGHTLGLRHNFKASATVPLEKLNDPAFTGEHGICNSVMDYIPVNIPENDKAAHFQTTLGAYDYWAIEYAYKPLPPDSKMSEEEMLEKIASRVAEPELQYATDEDAFGSSTRSIDPLVNLFDLGSDPLAYARQRVKLARELWNTIPDKFEKKGERYTKLRQVFNQGIGEYYRAALIAPKFVGGLYFHRDHIGDPNGRLPYRVVPAEKQREALRFVLRNLFAEDAFSFDPQLLNKLAPEKMWDFEGTVFRAARLDYPIHGLVQLIQATAMFRLYDPLVLLRLQDNELRFEKGEKPFTMAEMFTSIRDEVWNELSRPSNINSFRRELQRMHLNVLNTLVVNSPRFLPHDAITLARADLRALEKRIQTALTSPALDNYTRAHLEESLWKIQAILNAKIEASY